MEESKPRTATKATVSTGLGYLTPERSESSRGSHRTTSVHFRQPRGIQLFLDGTIHLTSFLLTAIICHLEQGYAGYLCRLSFWTCVSVSVELIRRDWMPGSQGGGNFIFDRYGWIVFQESINLYSHQQGRRESILPCLAREMTKHWDQSHIISGQ